MRKAPLLLALACLAAPAPASARVLPVIMGDDAAFLHGNDEDVRAALGQAAALGVDRVRLTANWRELAPEPEAATPPSFAAAEPLAYPQARWATLDRAVREAHAANLRLMLDVGFWAPRWATTTPADDHRPRHDIDPAAFRDFATAVVIRYGGSFTPPGASEPLPPVGLFAIWNEPNHTAFLMPQWTHDGTRWRAASPDRYAAMVRAAYPAMKAIAPWATILVGNTSARGGRGGRSPVAPMAFLRRLACVDRRLRPERDGACASFTPLPGDGWAHHPYALGVPPEKSSGPTARDDVRLADLPRLVALLGDLVEAGRLAPGMRDVWLTEYGYETMDLVGQPGVSEATQARWMAVAERLVSRMSRIRAFSQFLLRDVPPAAVRVSDSSRRPFGQFGTGLFHADGTAKIAASTFQAGLAAVRTCPSVEVWVRLRLGPEPHRVMVQRANGRGQPYRLIRSTVRRGRGVWSFRTANRPGARYRLLHRGADGVLVSGLPVKVRGRPCR